MCQSQVNESQDSKEQTTSSTMSQLKQTQHSTSNYTVIPEQEGECDTPLNPFSQH